MAMTRQAFLAMNKTGKKVIKYVLGECMPTVKDNATKIRIKKLGLDTNLLMYFNEYEFVYAYDPYKLCKTGDTVLIQNLPERMTRLITHKVIEVVYPLGDITDPLTGKKVVSGKYRDQIQEEIKLYGKLKSNFDYNEAPPRGSMEGIRDFSHKESYIKYYDDPNDPQNYAV
ncbi:GSCOCG00010714001-RA-CDS [Cotesia congregata]|uniref:Mitochondrial (Bos taurus) n=1 Tax=Cotesia congregata TaxID=51543 RepID=A0A8J2HFT8_COTCN|nr:GSCOCG00010714001-RA-CDS [Cotesia congregata]CAG5093442.1 Similar to MRPS17: 28S ribosomal protein S17 [Cotesia congregata]